MMSTIDVKVPDMGDFKDVPVIQVLVKPGDAVRAEDSLVTLESDKATIDIPTPKAGTVREVKVKVGDRVSEGRSIITLEATEVPSPSPSPSAAPSAAAAAGRPDGGDVLPQAGVALSGARASGARSSETSARPSADEGTTSPSAGGPSGHGEVAVSAMAALPPKAEARGLPRGAPAARSFAQGASASADLLADPEGRRRWGA